MPGQNETFSYSLTVGSEANRRSITAWLLLGLVSLVAAGIFSILLVLARTPVVQGLVPLLDFFRIALVAAEFCIGIAAVITELPIGIAVAHNWLAAMLLLALLRLLALCRNEQALR